MRLAHTMIRVKDLEETLGFYQSFIGLREVGRKSIGDEATLVFLADDAGHYHIELTHNHGETGYELGNQFGHLAFATPDLNVVIEEVERRLDLLRAILGRAGHRRAHPRQSKHEVDEPRPAARSGEAPGGDGMQAHLLQGSAHDRGSRASRVPVR